MSKIALTTLLTISLTGLATVATPTASAFWCGPSQDPTLAYVARTCDEALGTAYDTLAPIEKKVREQIPCVQPC